MSSRLFLQLAEESWAGRIGQASRSWSTARYHPDSGRAGRDGTPLVDQATTEGSVLERAVERDPAQLVANKLLCEAWIRLGDAEQARSRLSIYRILNERDIEIGQLEHRIGGLERPRSAEPRTAAPRLEDRIFALEPLSERTPIALLDVLAPLPAVETPSWAPFAGIHDRRSAEKRILGRFQAEGIFRVAAPGPAAAEPMLRPGEATAEPVPFERAETLHVERRLLHRSPRPAAAARLIVTRSSAAVDRRRERRREGARAAPRPARRPP
jgi:hypothetical protein